MLHELLQHVREEQPLIHCMTNYVTANDCANLLLAGGASPVMADDPGEVRDITGASDGLVLNLGTLSQARVPAMLEAGKTANARGIPVVLDPVGAGASGLRTESAQRILQSVRCTVIRCNSAELWSLAGFDYYGRGVDAGGTVDDMIMEQTVSFVKAFSAQTGSVILMTGSVDIAAYRSTAICIRNGDALMQRVTGTGCMLSALTAAFLAANPAYPLYAAAGAACAMGLCGEIARQRMTEQDGTAAFRSGIIDAMYHLTPEQLKDGAKYEIR